MPTAAERNGDFSGLINTAGQPVIIYDPLTKLPFPGNIIPANRINPVAAAMIKYLPLPDINVDNGSTNYNRTSLINNNFETEIAVKVEHKFTDKVSLTGFYLYNRTNEPCQNYFGTADQTEPNRFADPLRLHPEAAAAAAGVEQHLGAERQLGDVAALRHDALPGQQHADAFRSIRRRSGFKSNYTQPDHRAEVPAGRADQATTRWPAGRSARSTRPQINWKSTSANAAYSRFFGTHTVKVGGDFRKIGDGQLPAGRQLGLLLLRQRVHLGEQLEQQRDVGQLGRVVPARLSVGELGQHQPVLDLDAAERLHLLHRRLRAGRLARELEVHGELRPPPRARDRPGRAEQQLHRRLRQDGDQRAVVGDRFRPTRSPARRRARWSAA